MKSSRMFALLLAVMVIFASVSVVSKAVMTITVPNITTLSYSLAANAMVAFGLPSLNRPVQINAACTTPGYIGVAHAAVMGFTTAVPQYMTWSGVESYSPPSPIGGRTSAAGTHMLFLDAQHLVDIEVNSPSSLRVHNSATGARSVIITIIY